MAYLLTHPKFVIFIVVVIVWLWLAARWMKYDRDNSVGPDGRSDLYYDEPGESRGSIPFGPWAFLMIGGTILILVYLAWIR